MDCIKVFNIIVILWIVLMIQDTEARSLRQRSGGHHRELNQVPNEVTKHSMKRHMKSHHKIDTLLNRLIEIENESSQLTNNNHHHPLRKRHETSGISIERMNDNTLAQTESLRKKRDERFEAQVKQVENSSTCNYTVTYINNSAEYILPKNLVNITCKERGATCRADKTACCLQTYTYIQVALKNSKHTHPMRINTGCVCVFQSSGELQHNITQPFIDSS